MLGDADGARAERQRADGIAPATALDHFDAALTSYRAGNTEAAFDGCRKALELHPDDFWAQYLKALCYLRDRRWGEAEEVLTVCQRLRPDFPWLFPLLGTAHMGMGLKQFDTAEKDFDRALASSDPALCATALTNRSALRRLQKRPGDAERDLREAIGLQPKVYQGYITLADLLRDRKDLSGALTMLDDALKQCGDNPALYSERARLHAEHGDRKAAQHDFEQVIKQDPDKKSDRVLAARVELAHLRLLAEEYDAALADCDAVLKARPNFPQAHRQRAEALLALGRNDEAAKALDQYVKMGGQPTPEALHARGLLHYEQHGR
jgi:tetratricopeptide (TPR) repeat protein